jgi:recombinational DNA repair protein RecR
MSILSEIFEGMKNFAFENEDVEIEAKRRITLCVDCDFFTENNTCKKCGCYMPFKTRSLKSSCALPEPLKKW